MSQTERLAINQAIVGRLTMLSSMYTEAYEAAQADRAVQLKRDWTEWYLLDEESKRFIHGYLKTTRST